MRWQNVFKEKTRGKFFLIFLFFYHHFSLPLSRRINPETI